MRGVNLAGMEGGYGGRIAGSNWSRTSGPVAGTDYPVHAPELIDYFKTKNIAVIRLLFTWERIQSKLLGPIPAKAKGYADYFANFKRAVDYATSLGIVVIIEPWQMNASGGAGGARWRGQLVGSSHVSRAAFADFWSKLATIFGGNPLVEYGLVNEPNSMSTMSWWKTAQQCVDAIRAAGATSKIYVPGNGYSAAGSWTDTWYDTAPAKRSNAYGWLNANGKGVPLRDPLQQTIAEVHVYLDPDGGGSSTEIVSATIARERIDVALGEAEKGGYEVFVGEIGFYAAEPLAPAAWADFLAYVESQPDRLTGYTWFAAGTPGWWDDVAADGGGHFSVTPTDAGAVYSGDTVNMTMIEGGFV